VTAARVMYGRARALTAHAVSRIYIYARVLRDQFTLDAAWRRGERYLTAVTASASKLRCSVRRQISTTVLSRGLLRQETV
jgi:hypothetical protein